MILRLAFRALATRPVRTIVLAFGFGLGIGIMAILLGVGEVILDQARSPALQGGGDVVIAGAGGSLDNARFVLANVLGAGDLAPRIAAWSPSKRTTLYLIAHGRPWPTVVRGGVPSLLRGVGDRETLNAAGWVDTPADRAWAAPDAASVLRAMDRFHAQPDNPEFAASWAEWLYFNGRSGDGKVRFYLTFLVGPAAPGGKQTAGVRLQLERDGRSVNFSTSAEVDRDQVLRGAPDLEIGDNRVRLDGLEYRIALHLPPEDGVGPGVDGELVLDARPGHPVQSLPPTVMRGARGWLSGYVVPVLSGAIRGSLRVGRAAVPLDGMTGYHDHNWGFWQDVHWQWGQVAHDDLSIVFGRVFPSASVADPARIPGFLGVLGPDGPLGLSTDVTIVERDVDGQPRQVDITARGNAVDLRLQLSVDRAIRTSRGVTPARDGSAMAFLQLSGVYRVTGHAAGRAIDFAARGAAETFRR